MRYPPGVTIWRNGAFATTSSTASRIAASSCNANLRRITAPVVRGSLLGSSGMSSKRFPALRRVLLCIVKDHSEGMTMTGAHAAHTMTEIYAINAARTLDRPIVHREDNAVSLAQRHYLYTRLHARPLLGHNELASMDVSSWFRDK